MNEDIIGKVLKKWFDSGKLTRDQIFLTTKLAPTHNKADAVEEQLKQSLAKLQLEYVDLYLIHHPCMFKVGETGAEIDGIVDYATLWKAMEDQVKAGRAKTIGVSNFAVRQIETILDTCKIKPACQQVELHLHMQQHGMVEYCKSNGICVVAYSSLGTPGAPVAVQKRNMKIEVPSLLTDEIVMKYAKKYSKTPAQILLRQIVQRGVAVIPKSTNEGRCKENFDIFNFSLNNDDIAELETLDKKSAGRIFNAAAMKGLADHPQNPYK